MELKQLKCRVHGGYFKVARKAGRPPTKCSADNICDQHPAFSGATFKKTRTSSGGRLPAKAVAAPSRRRRRAEKVVETPTPKKPKPTLRGINRAALNTGSRCDCPELNANHEKGIEGCRYATRGAPTVVHHNPSVPLAFEAKRLLEPLGWTVKGLPFDGEGVVVTGQRGTETISLTWIKGKLVKEHYSMFPSDVPTVPGMPRKRLPFEPSEMDDAGLIKALSGKKVTWWNLLGQKRETVTMPHRADQKIKVERLMNGHGDETARIVSFVDQDGTGFRAFNVNALLDVK